MTMLVCETVVVSGGDGGAGCGVGGPTGCCCGDVAYGVGGDGGSGCGVGGPTGCCCGDVACRFAGGRSAVVVCVGRRFS